MAEDSLKKKTLAGLFWTFAQRIGTQLVSFLVQIILARLLATEEYGIIAIVLVFVNICNVFVDRGFGRALIQKLDADELDFSSVFWASLMLTAGLYAMLYGAAPMIARFYGMDILVPVLRVMGLRLIISAVNTVQRAKVSRDMQFRKFFLSSLGGMAVSAVVGIVMAYLGFGIWALVAQNLTNVLIDTLILLVTVQWRPRLQFSFQRLRALFGFGWKVMLSALLDTVYEEFRTLYVGKLHTPNDLSFFDRGKQFPYLIIDNVNTSITSVLFPAIASQQKDRETVRGMTRRAMKISAYILSPMLFGLAAVAEPLVELVLTEKWLPCVPYLQILCINCVLTPLHTANTQAILALGRSDIALKLNLAKKGFGFLAVVLLTPISVTAMALGGVATGVFSLLLNILPNGRLLGYGYKEQLRDVLPAWLLSGVMFLLVRLVAILSLPLLPELALMIVVGMGSYVLLSALFQVESFCYLLNMIKPVLNKFKR